MDEGVVGVFGASSLVGGCLLPLLDKSQRQVVAFSRQLTRSVEGGVIWHQTDRVTHEGPIHDWISLAPIWVLPEYFEFLEQCSVRRIVALSSTSRFTKTDSTDSYEQAVARRLSEAEDRLVAWADDKGVDCCVLRPTLIYGLGRDGNVSEIIRMVRRFRFFPLLGKAMGLRQPVHAADVAQACLAALERTASHGRCYNLSGGETLPYRQMIEQIFQALELRPRFISVPLPLFRLAVNLLRLLPRYRHWSGAMAERMNRDMVFDHTEAARDLGFKPRGFTLEAGDFPSG